MRRFGGAGRRRSVEELWRRLRPGARAGPPYAVAAGLLGVSFGAVAQPLMGYVAAQARAVVDASWALASRGGGRFDRDFIVGSTLDHYRSGSRARRSASSAGG